MPKKKAQESQATQSERFQKAVRDMIDAGELNPIEADKALENLLHKTRSLNPPTKQAFLKS